AHFGLGKYKETIDWLNRGQDEATKQNTGVAPWEYEACARQLASLARLQDGATEASQDEAAASSQDVGTAGSKSGPAIDALKDFFGEYPAQSAYVGKIGLALSGGGFRASLFHIGVLARLAELDVLRGVEVLSCVSGGSIIGAHYYLEVRKLLQTKSDKDITKEDYIDIVAKVRKDFLDGVQRNIRTRVVLNPLLTLKMF